MSKPILTAENCSALFSSLEVLVMKGQHELFKAEIKNYNFRKLPREWAWPFASLAVRSHVPLVALKALHGFIYPENNLMKAASDQEKVIYASALFNLGLSKESIVLLSSVDADTEPEVLFARASAYFFDWNYEAGIPELENYIRSEKITPYRKLVGQVNLAAALISLERWAKAEVLLGEIQMHCEHGQHFLLLGNCFELQSQAALLQGHYDTALELLEKAHRYLKDQAGLYLLYVEKWTCIARGLKARSFASGRDLDCIREKAINLKHWNTIRECDLFESILNRDSNLLRKVIFGTPSEHYRQRSRRLFGSTMIAKGEFIWEPPLAASQQSAVGERIVFNPYKKNNLKKELHENQMLLKIFEALNFDLYQPCSIGTLFQRAYPGEIFNPFTTPPRVLQLLRRLNAWFIDVDLGLRIDFVKSEFRLKALSPIAVVIQRGSELNSEEIKIQQLKEKLGDRSFSIRQVSHILAISSTGAGLLLKKAVQEGRLIRMGQGRNTSYRYAPVRKTKRLAA